MLQANTSCLHLLNQVFRPLRSTRDCFWVLNTLAMPLAFLLPMIYFAHTHTHTLDPTYQFCTSLHSPSIPQQLKWGKRPGEKEPGPVIPPRPLDYKPSLLFFHACLYLNLPVPQGKQQVLNLRCLALAGTWMGNSSPQFRDAQPWRHWHTLWFPATISLVWVLGPEGTIPWGSKEAWSDIIRVHQHWETWNRWKEKHKEATITVPPWFHICRKDW